MASQDKLNDIVEKVEREFTARVEDLSNSECEYVLAELVNWFDGWLERVRETSVESELNLTP